MKKLLIIGGGITGLSAAWAASRSSPGIDITLVDRDQGLGGKIRTDRAGGFLLEEGPDSFLTSRPEALRLCEELGISRRLISRTPRRNPTFIMRGHALFPLPKGFSGMMPMDTAALAVSPLLSEAGRRRAMEGPSSPEWTGGDDESVASFVVRRFGEEVFQLLVEPLVGGIHAGDAALLSREAILGQPRRDKTPASGRPSFLSFPEGTGELVSTLEQRLGGIRILRGTGVESVSRAGTGYRVETSGGRHEADALIVATPAFETARMFAQADPELCELLGMIPFASTVVIHLAYRRSDIPHPLDGYGYLIPSVEGSDLVACTWSSLKWEGRSPEDIVLMRLFAGRFGRRDLIGRSEDELFSLCREELAGTLRIRAEPMLQRMHRWDMGMPQYTVGHLRRVQDIRASAGRHPGLFLAGASYDGVGIPQCVQSGTQAAEAAFADLG
jgi:oxygen-dependent protoporphyrinogen oxidase